MNAIRIIPRLERDSAGNWIVPVLFLPDDADDRVGSFVGCYSHVGQHSHASMTYYRHCTRPLRGSRLADGLVREYASLPPHDTQIVVMSRMPHRTVTV